MGRVLRCCARVGVEAGPGQAPHGAEVDGAAGSAPEGAQLACRGARGDTWGVGEGSGKSYDRERARERERDKCECVSACVSALVGE